MEQLTLIADHLWLVDLQKIFKGQKYILIVGPSQPKYDSNDAAVLAINSTQVYLDQKIADLKRQIEGKMKHTDKNNQYMLQIQYSAIDLMMGRLREIDESVQAAAIEA